MPDLKQTVIADTSVIYYLDQISLLELLPALYGTVNVTPEVISELEAGAKQNLSVPNVQELKPNLIKLKDAGFFLADNLFEHALIVVGESD